MLLALLAAGSFAAAPRTVTLFRGAELPGQSTRYWAVQDVSLDQRRPNQNEGGLPFLAGGPSRTILIRFGDLNRALGASRVRSARLIFRTSGGSPSLDRVARVRVPWREGGEGPIRPWAPRPPEGTERTARPGNPTWTHRTFGPAGLRWSQAGARGEQDAEPISGPSLALDAEGNTVISGLESLVQRWLDAPESNFGLALSLVSAADFLSSESPEGAPRLVVEVEPVPDPSGPDLTISLVSKASETSRRDVTEWVTVNQDGREIRLPRGVSQATEWPEENAPQQWTVHVRNLGSAESAGGRVVLTSDSISQTLELPGPIAAGGEAKLTLTVPFRERQPGYKLRPLVFRVEPQGADSVASNNGMAVEEAALTLEVVLPSELSARAPRVVDWLNDHVRALNEWVLPHSRFSFAPEGGLERVRVQVLADPSGGAQPAGTDARVVLPADVDLSGLDRRVLAALVRPLGLFSTPGESLAGPTVRGLDPFAGLLGYGDTRDETNLPPILPLPGAPIAELLVESAGIRPTDLLSATDVGALNARVWRRDPPLANHLFAASGLIFVRARNFQGRVLPETQLEIFAAPGGVPSLTTPIFSVTTTAAGLANLPRRPTLSAEKVELGGVELVAGPFGALDPTGGNDALLVKATRAGVSEYAWLKAWQLVDAKYRSPGISATVDLFFNLGTGPVDGETDLARGRPVRDSEGRLPAQLAGLVDDQSGSVSLPAAAGGWVEIDLGRDRVIGEIALEAEPGEAPPEVDILTYTTGQTLGDALPWTQDRAFRWSLAARGKDGVVAYRAFAQRIRFIRIVSVKGGGSLRKVLVRPLRG